MDIRSKLSVILHADVVASTALVRRDERRAHERIQSGFRRLSEQVLAYGGDVLERRGDAVVAAFDRGSDAVLASLAHQAVEDGSRDEAADSAVPMRIGIAIGEVVIADHTVTGTGVVLAQRLEQIAPAGGVVVQGAVRETLPHRLPVAVEALGEQRLKGFEEPVRAFAVSLSPGAALPPPEPASAGVTAPRGAHAHPVIAVLSFENRGADPEQAFLADGLAEDITAALSSLRWLTVIARASAHRFASDDSAGEAALALALDYAVRGSVRRAGDRLRIAVRLERAVTGEQLWAERYDRTVADWFEIEDEIAASVIARLQLEIGAAEQARLRDVPATTLNAWEAFQRGLAAQRGRVSTRLDEAKRWFEKAIEIDPDFAAPRAELALGHINEITWAVIPPEERDGQRALAMRLAEDAVRADPRESLAYVARARVLVNAGKHAAAAADIESALALNPNSAVALRIRGYTRAMGDDPEGALLDFDTAHRLSPFDPDRGPAALRELRVGVHAASTLPGGGAVGGGGDPHSGVRAVVVAHGRRRARLPRRPRPGQSDRRRADRAPPRDQRVLDSRDAGAADEGTTQPVVRRPAARGGCAGVSDRRGARVGLARAGRRGTHPSYRVREPVDAARYVALEVRIPGQVGSPCTEGLFNEGLTGVSC